MSRFLSPDEQRAVARYRRMWRAYPSDFRRRFEDDAMDVFLSRYREEHARASRVTMALFWMRSGSTVLLHGIAERLSGASEVGLGAWRSDVAEVIRSGRRSARRHVAAVLCVALGLAATSAVLTLVSSTLFRPLPFPDSERLVRIWGIEESVELAGRGQLSYPDLRELQRSVATVDRFVAAGRSRQMFLGESGARRVEGEAVTDGYFDLLGIEPHLGRTFLRDDHRAGSSPTLILSFSTWLRDYGGDPGVLGTTLRTAGRDFTIIGVLPGDFLGTVEADIPDLEFWIPLEHQLTEALRENRGAEFIWTIGRLDEGRGLADVRNEVAALTERLMGEGVLDTAEGYWAEPLGENWRAELRSRNLLLLGAALLLLLVAATNVAGLQLARAAERRRESAVRAALGASPRRLVRLSVLETVLTTGVGGLLGLALAPVVLRSFLRIAPEALPGYVNVTPDVTSLAVSFLVLAATALVSAVAPGLLQARTSPGQALVSGGRSATQGRGARKLSRGLVVGEIAVTTVLLTSAVLLVQSYRAMGQADVGFRSDGILKAAVFVDSQDVPEPSALPAFYRSLKERLARVPGIDGVGLASPTVPPGFSGEGRVRFDGMPDVSREAGLLAYTHLVDEEMMPVLEIPLLAGRGVEATDGPDGGNVVVVSESLARAMGGIDAAVGRQIELFDASFDVVGVAGDVMYLGAAVPRPRDIDVYLPITAEPTRIVSMAIRTSEDPEAMIEPVRAAIAELTPRSPLDWVAAMPTDLRRGFEGPRFYTVLLLAFAGSALLLTAAGVFALLARKVAGERAEFGIRRAFGASRLHVVGSVVRSGVLLSGAGLGLGAVGAAGVTWLMGGTLFGIAALDLRGPIVAAVVILVVSVLASLIPALRATGVHPVEAIRES